MFVGIVHSQKTITFDIHRYLKQNKVLIIARTVTKSSDVSIRDLKHTK